MPQGPHAAARPLLLLLFCCGSHALLIPQPVNVETECKPYLPDSGPKGSGTFCSFQEKEQAYLHGRWVRRPRDCRVTNASVASFAYNYRPKCNAALVRCHITDPNACAAKQTDILDYRWEPSDCRMEAFSASKMDELLAGKKVAFIGDSVSHQMFNSLKQLMASETVEDGWLAEMQRTGGKVLNWTRVPYGREFIKTKRSAYILHAGSNYLCHRGRKFRSLETSFVKPVRWADVVVINVGVHWHKRDADFARYAETVEVAIKFMAKWFRGTHIIFRTTVPGNYGCHAASGPLEHIPALDETNDWYNWRKPPVAERVWQRLAAEAGLADRFYMLNVSASVLRADAHPDWALRRKNGTLAARVDCLHWCLPGVPDGWNHLLYNLLLSSRKALAAPATH